MGILKPCLSVSGDSVEYAVIETYDEPDARTTPPGFDDVLGEPYLVDSDDDGIGDRVRPGTEITIKAKAKFSSFEEQRQDQTGNEPASFLTLTAFARDLTTRGYLSNGTVMIRPNDRVLRLQNGAGAVRVDFTRAGREGVYVVEVRPGETGSGIYEIVCEARREVER